MDRKGEKSERVIFFFWEAIKQVVENKMNAMDGWMGLIHKSGWDYFVLWMGWMFFIPPFFLPSSFYPLVTVAGQMKSLLIGEELFFFFLLKLSGRMSE